MLVYQNIGFYILWNIVLWYNWNHFVCPPCSLSVFLSSHYFYGAYFFKWYKQLFIWYLMKLYACHFLNFLKVWSHGKIFHPTVNQLAQVSRMELIGRVVTWSDLTIDLWCNWASAWTLVAGKVFVMSWFSPQNGLKIGRFKIFNWLSDFVFILDGHMVRF